jgi:hypothetical protein
MSDKVIKLVPKDQVPVDKLLDEVKAEGLTGVLVLGWTKDGHLYMTSSIQDGPPVLWMLECGKFALMHEAGSPHDAG